MVAIAMTHQLHQLVLVAVVLLLVSPAAPAQGAESRDTAQSVERYKDFLARKPYHDWAFQKLVEAAIARNQLRDLVADYQRRLKEEPENVSHRIVLARLYVATDQSAQALTELRALKNQDANLFKLIGELELKRNDAKAALVALDQAVALTKDGKLLQEIHQKRGQAALSAGDRGLATQAFRAIAALEPKSFNTRLEVATSMARNGLADEAAVEFATARELAGEDSVKLCRVLAEEGRLLETRSKAPEAVAVYRRAIGLMARGNWLKRDLYDRLLAIHKRGNILDQLAAGSRAAVEKAPQDLDEREFWARVLEESGKRKEAAAVLRAGVELFPDDLRLSRNLLRVLGDTGDTDGVIAEYQRIIGKFPEELDLYLELGTVFAREKRLEQARLQWSLTLEKRLTDAALCVRLAQLYATYGLGSDAVTMFEKAITLEPKEVRHYGDLADHLLGREKKDDAFAVVERAGKAAAGNPALLEQVSNLWRGYGEPARAKALLREALGAKADDPRLLAALADAQIELGEDEDAVESLHQVIERSDEAPVRQSAVDRIVRVQRKQNKLGALVRAEEKKVATGARQVAPYLILAKCYAERREPTKAIEVLQKLAAISDRQEEGRRQLARLYEEIGEFGQALEQYDLLIKKAPQARRQYLESIARIHLTLLDQDQAVACYEEMLRGATDNPAVFRDVANAYQKLNLTDRAIECLAQAVRLKPDDGRTRIQLSDLLARSAEWGRARDELVLAMKSTDADVQSDARKRFYTLLSEQGRLDDEVAAIRRRLDENPYDTDAALELADLYVREQEYELALEMVEKLLTLNPQEPRLLAQRARVLGLTDRHADAIRDYETLAKLPDANQDALAVKLVETALNGGDVPKAREVAHQASDKLRLARIFQRQNLPDEAIALLKEGVGKMAVDPKVLIKLAEVSRQKGDRSAAVEYYEKALAITGERWDTILALGSVYHELGKKSEVINCGMRLITMIRMREEGEQREKEREREAAAESDEAMAFGNDGPFGIYDNWDASGDTQYEQGLNEIGEYFIQKGLEKDLALIVAKELEIQPLNVAVFDHATNYLLNQERNAVLGVQIINRNRALTVEKGRHPPSYTLRQWSEHLDRELSRCYEIDVKLAGERVRGLTELTASGKATERDWILLAELLKVTRRMDELLPTIDRGLAAFPQSSGLLAARAVELREKKDFAGAAETLRRLIPLLEADPAAKPDPAELTLEWRKVRPQLHAQVPPSCRGRIKDADYRRVFDLTHGEGDPGLGWGLAAHPNLRGARFALASALARAGQAAAAKEEFARLRPDDPDALNAWEALGAAYSDAEFFAEAQQIYEPYLARATELENDPVLGWFTEVHWNASRAAEALGHILEKQGKLLEAYDLLRSYDQPGPAKLILTTHQLFDAAAARYSAALDSVERALAAQPPKTGRELEALRHAGRDAGVKLAEIEQARSQWEKAIAALDRVWKLDPEAFDAAHVTAQLYERLGRMDEAIRVEEKIIAGKREVNHQLRRDEHPPGRVIVPEAPPKLAGSSEDWIWQNLQNGGYGSGAPSRQSLNENYVFIVRNLLDRRLVSRAAELLRDLAREDASTFRWMGWTMGRIIQNYDLGAAGLPILRLIYAWTPTDDDVSIQYASCLAAADRLDEAQRILTTVLGRSTVDASYRDRAREELKRIEARLGTAKRETTADLALAVKKEPHNVSKRLKLCRRLIDEEQVAEALPEALELEKLAPHQDEVQAIVVQCLSATGDWAGALERLRRQIDEAKSPEEQFRLTLVVAQFLHADGKLDQAIALFNDVYRRMKKGWNDFDFAYWLIEKESYDVARQMLQARLDQAGQAAWSRGLGDVEALRQRVLRLQLRDHDVVAALDILYARQEALTQPGERADVLCQAAVLLKSVANPEAFRAPILAAAEKVGGVRAEVYRLILGLSTGDVPLAEKSADAILAAEPTSIYLYPLLIGLARVRRDLRGALQRMDDLDKLNPWASGHEIWRANGMISEHDLFRSERGALQLKLGDREGALRTWREIYDEHRSATWRTLVDIYRQNELWDDALALMKKYLEKEGERLPADLDQLADLCFKVQQFDAGIAALEREVVLSAGDDNNRRATQERIISEHRRAGRLAEYLQKLQQRVARDATDVEAVQAVAQVATELGDTAVAVAALETIRSKPGMEKGVLLALAAQRQLAGDLPGAIEALEKHGRGNLGEWSRKTNADRIAALYFRLGDDARGMEALRARNKGVEDAQSLEELGRACSRRKKHAEALAAYRRALEIEPRHVRVLADIAAEQRKSGDDAGALASWFQFLRGDRSVIHPYPEEVAAVPALAERLKEDERLAKALEAQPDDHDAAFRQATLATLRGKWSVGTATFERLAKEAPDDLAILDRLRIGYEVLGRAADAMSVAEREMIVAERRAAVDQDFAELLQRLRRWLVTMRLRAGDVPGAILGWKKPVGARTAPVSVWQYSPGNFESNDNPGDQLWRILAQHRRFAEALPLIEERTLLGTGSKADYAGLLGQSGDVRRAREILWTIVVDPLADEVGGGGGGGQRWYTGNESAFSARPEVNLLIESYRETGEMDALVGEVRTRLKANPDAAGLRSLLVDVLAASRSWEDLRLLYEEDLKKDPENEVTLGRLESTLRKLARFDDALPIVEKLVRLERAAAFHEGERRAVTRYFGQSPSIGSRFRWTGGSSPYGYFSATSTSYEWRGDDDGSGHVRVLLGLYARLGNSEAKARLEKEILNSSRWDFDSAWGDVVSAYCAADLPADAERAWRELLRSSDPGERPWILRQVITTCRRVKDQARHDRLRDEALVALGARIQIDPYSANWHAERASLIVAEGGDPAVAAADAEAIRTLAPEDPHGRLLGGWAALRAGNAAAARAFFQESERVDLGAVEIEGPEFLYGFGLALAADPASKPNGMALLRRALARYPDHGAAAEARQVVGP